MKSTKRIAAPSSVVGKKILVANRSEIAIRVFRAATELGMRTVAIYAQEDRLSMHRFKADEAYMVGEGKGPVGAYLDIEGIVGLAKEHGVDMIHPGYGFLSENPEFVEAVVSNGMTFIGPPASAMRALGSKTSARDLMQKANVPIVPVAFDFGNKTVSIGKPFYPTSNFEKDLKILLNHFKGVMGKVPGYSFIPEK